MNHSEAFHWWNLRFLVGPWVRCILRGPGDCAIPTAGSGDRCQKTARGELRLMRIRMVMVLVVVGWCLRMVITHLLTQSLTIPTMKLDLSWWFWSDWWRRWVSRGQLAASGRALAGLGRWQQRRVLAAGGKCPGSLRKLVGRTCSCWLWNMKQLLILKWSIDLWLWNMIRLITSESMTSQTHEPMFHQLMRIDYQLMVILSVSGW